IAYVNSTYNGAFCLDVSNPKQPKSIAYAIPWNEKENRPDFMASLAIVDDVIYAAGYGVGLWVIPAKGFAKRVTPRTNMPVPPEPIASDLPSNEELLTNFAFYKTDGQIGAVCKEPRDNSLWVASGKDGLHRIEIRDNQPVCLKKYPTPGAAYDVKRAGDLLLCAQADKGLAIYKVDQDANIKEIGRFTTIQSIRQVVVSNNAHWAIAKVGNGKLFFLDLTRPESPRVAFKDSYPLGIMYGREIVQSVTNEGIASAFFWGFGFAWYDLSGDTPKKLGLKPAKSGSLFGGAIQNGKLYYSQRNGFYVFDLLDTSPLDKESFCSIPKFEGGGKIFMNGTIACVMNRRNGSISTFDFANLKEPKLLKQYKVKGHPDPGIFLNDGRMIIPCGYAGLMIEKR
ncbi:MAG: hypothetical protein Q4G59_09410, partial [Planctomycetia bacterium]|nr:hypothetical protein [Planctomycetia bacterium]